MAILIGSAFRGWRVPGSRTWAASTSFRLLGARAQEILGQLPFPPPQQLPPLPQSSPIHQVTEGAKRQAADRNFVQRRPPASLNAGPVPLSSLVACR